jgi:hypothetical protein
LATNNIPVDLLAKQADLFAVFLDEHSDAIATGTPLYAGILKLSDDLLDVNASEAIANLITEEIAQDDGPSADKLMLLSELGEMLASFQKEYYVMSKRHDRINRAARGISSMKHSGGETGVVLGRIKNAGGAYSE